MNVINLATARERPEVKACESCRHLINPRDDAYIWQCGLSGMYTEVEFKLGECGRSKILWEPRPPGFWSRLGDAIIERIKGKKP